MRTNSKNTIIIVIVMYGFVLCFVNMSLGVFLYFKFLWNEVCDKMLNETNQAYVTPKLVTKLMYAFRDIQVVLNFCDAINYIFFLFTKDYESMIKLSQRCEQLGEIDKKLKNNMMISYLTAFARSR